MERTQKLLGWAIWAVEVVKAFEKNFEKISLSGILNPPIVFSVGDFCYNICVPTYSETDIKVGTL